MGVFDQAARFAARADPDAVARRTLTGTKAALRFADWADTRTLSRPGGSDRTADLVAVLEDAALPNPPGGLHGGRVPCRSPALAAPVEVACGNGVWRNST